MSGKAAKSTSTSTTGSAQAWANPYAQAGAANVQSVFNANQPGLQQLTDLTRGSVVTPLLGKFNQSLSTAGKANDYYSDVIDGKYMPGNPYISNILSQLNRGVGDQVNSQFEMSGRYGSGAHADVLSRNLADADAGVLYQNYGDEMARRDAAAQSAGQSNAVDISSLLAAIGAGAQLPYTGTSNLADSLGALFSGGTETSKSTGPKPGLLDYLAAGASNVAAAYAGKGG